MTKESSSIPETTPLEALAGPRRLRVSRASDLLRYEDVTETEGVSAFNVLHACPVIRKPLNWAIVSSTGEVLAAYELLVFYGWVSITSTVPKKL